jgi:hypothetical protein
MSGINIPFPIDWAVLGDVVGSLVNPSYPPDCYAQGLVKDDTLDPSVPSQVVKFEVRSAQLKVFALHGKFSASAGVMSSKVHPAIALSATFDDEGRVSKAVFGSIEPITETNVTIHALAGIHATFEMLPEKKARCTKVHITDTYWAPWLFGGTHVTNLLDAKEYFCRDFISDETFVQVIKPPKVIKDRVVVEGCTTQLFLMPNGTTHIKINGRGQPSGEDVARAEQMLMECNALLQSKIGVIKWLEDHRVERHEQPEPPVNAVFNWMHGFQSAMLMQMPRPSIFGHALMPGMSRSVLERLMYIDPSGGLSASAGASNRGIQPCKCNPMRRDPECNNRFCPFKHSGLILVQPNNKRPLSERFEALTKEANAAEEFAAKGRSSQKKGGSKTCKRRHKCQSRRHRG